MSPFECPHIENPAALRRRTEAERRLRADAFEKVRRGRWDTLTAEQFSWVVSQLAEACPDA